MKLRVILTKDGDGTVESQGVATPVEYERLGEAWAEWTAEIRDEVENQRFPMGGPREYGVVTLDVSEDEVERAFARTRRQRGSA